MRKNFPVSDIQYVLDEKTKLMSVTTPDSHITYANRDFIKASGYDFAEIIDQPHNIVRHPDMPPAAFADMWSTLKSGKIWTAIVKNRRKNGDYYWVKASTTPLIKNGNIAGYMSVRTTPLAHEIKEADSLYKNINEEKLKTRELYQGLLIYKGSLKLLSLFKIIPVRWRIRVYFIIFLLLALGLLIYVFPANIVTLLFALFLFIGALVTSELLVQHLARPLESILKQAIKAASGQADLKFELKRVDEVGMLLRAVNQSGMNFRTFVDDVSGQLAELRTACAEIAKGNNMLSQRCQETAENLQNTASSMEEITVTIKSNASATQLAENFAQEANQAAGAGEEAVQEVAQTMKTLIHSSHEINNIIGVLNNLSFRTNILALNAAVEAAHAGEMGKSFAIVAGEVRMLAERSASSARDIASIIQLTIDNINSGDRMVEHTSKSMSHIHHQVQQVNELVKQITHATQEQSIGMSQINDAVNNIDDATRQNTTLASHASTEIERLQSQITTMAEAVSVFSNTH
ncbi:chemotaxis protein [Prodigiosinella confusarubida]|uniref:Chemotaxis protein n=1 Tax=Serratia sp. (strain ATCC 39006) TaxID=104623 RepID=A0A2I5T7J5_SERS3|nr:PAS domain-containing methyl-accepting chemotaxis protein [Serratia sp. ATCC 39006]AUH00559.1 chemotaxis protein [Serratia sp. ATCC 39006]AUH04880.1 chemotaxis protein [Serratia sp. ATCC 39006]